MYVLLFVLFAYIVYSKHMMLGHTKNGAYYLDVFVEENNNI